MNRVGIQRVIYVPIHRGCFTTVSVNKTYIQIQPHTQVYIIIRINIKLHVFIYYIISLIIYIKCNFGVYIGVIE